MFIAKRALPRRTLLKGALKGAGVSVALPLLDAMIPALSAKTAAPPPRLGFVYVSNGVIQEQWNPAPLKADATGTGFELTPILKPLEPVRDHINVLSGLAHLAGRHLRRRHRRPSPSLGRVAHRRARLGPHPSGRGSAPGHHRGPIRRARNRQGHAGAFARAQSGQPHAGRLRFRRLLLRQHRLLAQ